MADDTLVGLGDRWQAHHATTAEIEDDDRLREVEQRLDAIEVKMLREGARTAKGLAAKLEVAHSLAVQSRCEEDALRMLASALRDCRRMAAALLLALLVPLLAGGPSWAFEEECLSSDRWMKSGTIAKRLRCDGLRPRLVVSCLCFDSCR